MEPCTDVIWYNIVFLDARRNAISEKGDAPKKQRVGQREIQRLYHLKAILSCPGDAAYSLTCLNCGLQWPRQWRIYKGGSKGSMEPAMEVMSNRP